ncbi:MAG TPA: hypothetical protein VFU79_05750 [Nitrososphaeraceae archaeon]|nr:hypothetical protein [Nitrososphaeraceae archaeon]
MSTDLLKEEETILNNNNNNNNNNNFTDSLKKELFETTYGSELIDAFLYPPYKRLQIGLDLEKPEFDYENSYSVVISL